MLYEFYLNLKNKKKIVNMTQCLTVLNLTFPTSIVGIIMTTLQVVIINNACAVSDIDMCLVESSNFSYTSYQAIIL